jgi:methionine-gamma-lyase
MAHTFNPESKMMSHGYKPELSEGSIKPPVFLTSTFGFKTAEEGKAFFEVAYGLREKNKGEEPGLIYSRINNPNLEILENRLCLWDQAEDCAVFESGMSAICTVMLEYLRPGDLLVYSSPCYGGTDHFIHDFLPKMDVMTLDFRPGHPQDELIQRIETSGRANRLSLIYIETPANPTNDLVDIAACRALADRFSRDGRHIPVAVDNTYMGPIWSQPLRHGADLVVYSATKYIGGHSDLIAGAVLGDAAQIKRIKALRTFFGNMCSPHTGWLMMRSLETLKIRMERQQSTAMKVAQYLQSQAKVKEVHYLGLLEESDPQYELYQRQYSGSGAMISVYLQGGEAEAFRFLNALKLVKLAVSLGSTESLAQHPASMTHIAVDPEDRADIGITEQLVRISVGVEDPDDLIYDLSQALEKV